MKKGKIELLAPAGSFTSGYYALEKGADAIYAGLSDFSARKQAKNFTFEEFRRLKTYADSLGKRIYIALNTVIREQEIPQLIKLLGELSLFEPAGIILQDPALISIIKRNFPGLSLHGSTQMAIHTAAGLEYLRDLGFSRVVLSRELSLKQITAIRQAVPGIEIEVFIHGALCYGFSGLCLASGMLLNRSGNRGECAQICRSWFESDGEKGYFFSCNDMALEEDVLKLRDAGIDSLKIEGRMKSPEYTAYTVAYYRGLLDGKKGGTSRKESRIAFARDKSTAFFKNEKGESLVNINYPAHKGIPVGRVLESRQDRFLVELSEPLTRYDGLLFFRKGNPPEAVKFGVKGLSVNNKAVIRSAPGERVWVSAPERPVAGMELFKISSQDSSLKEVNPSILAPAKVAVNCRIALSEKEITISAVPLPWSRKEFRVEIPVEPEEARQEKDFKEILLQHLSRSDTSYFTVDKIIMENNTPYRNGALFIPPSRLKDIRKTFFRDLDAFLQEEMASLVPPARASEPAVTPSGVRRSEWLYHEERLPFVADFSSLTIEQLPRWSGRYVLALLPVTIHREEYFAELTAFLESHRDSLFLIGLSNWGHLKWIETLRKAGDLRFFVDYPLYCANREAYDFYFRQIPDPEFIFYWIEGGAEDYRLLSGLGPLIQVDSRFIPHLFISRVCYRKNSAGLGCGNCPKTAEYRLTQNKAAYRVVVKDCLTYLFEDKIAGSLPRSIDS